MRKQWILFALILPALTLASTIPEGTLTGRITDPAGAVVGNVPVRIQHWEIDKFHRFSVTEDSLIKTDRDGRYSITLKAGVYDIFVTFPSFSPVARRVKVEAGKTVDFSPKLKFDRASTFVE